MGDGKKRFNLYMSGTSYFSQKVLMALWLKNEPFDERFVNQRTSETFAPWFMKMNPKGQVPVLEDLVTGKVLWESEDIITYLDTELPTEPFLVPELSTDLGKEVDRFRKLLNISTPAIFRGLEYNPQFTPNWKPGKTKEELDDDKDELIAKLEKLAIENPDLRDQYLAKIPPIQKRKSFSNPELVKKALDDLQEVMDEVETRLLECSKDSQGRAWLFGNLFTAADISLTILLRRLTFLGMSSLYFTPKKRTASYKYWMQLQDFAPYCRLDDIATKYGVVY